MAEAQEAKGYGIYAHQSHNKLRSFHVRSKSEFGIQHIEVEGKEYMTFENDDDVRATRDNARDRRM
jgi:hypothetical protein